MPFGAYGIALVETRRSIKWIFISLFSLSALAKNVRSDLFFKTEGIIQGLFLDKV